MPQNNTSRCREHGNVFIFILLGVVLFAALSYTVARGMRGDTANSISDRQAALAASDIITYAQRIERAVNKMRRKGISESDISFDNNFVTGYNHTPAQPDTNKIFHPSGGNVTYTPPLSDWLETFASAPDLYGEWYIPDATRIFRLGPNGLDTVEAHNDSVSNEDLILVLPYIKQNICIEINKKLGISTDDTIPQDSNNMWSVTEPKYTGTFTDSGVAIEAGGGGPSITNEPTACVEGGGGNPATGYHFYYTLIVR